RRASAIAVEVAALEGPVLAFHVSKFPHALQKSTEIALRHRLRAANQTRDQRARRSLGYPGDWPRHRATQKINECPSFQPAGQARGRQPTTSSRAVLHHSKLRSSTSAVGQKRYCSD